MTGESRDRPTQAKEREGKGNTGKKGRVKKMQMQG